MLGKPQRAALNLKLLNTCPLIFSSICATRPPTTDTRQHHSVRPPACCTAVPEVAQVAHCDFYLILCACILHRLEQNAHVLALVQACFSVLCASGTLTDQDSLPRMLRACT